MALNRYYLRWAIILVAFIALTSLTGCEKGKYKKYDRYELVGVSTASAYLLDKQTGDVWFIEGKEISVVRSDNDPLGIRAEND